MERWRIGELKHRGVDDPTEFASLRYSITPSSAFLSSIRQKRRVSRFEANVFRQLRRIEAEDDGVSAAGQLSVELRVGVDRLAVDPDTRARCIGKFETSRPRGCDLEFRPKKHADESRVFVLLHDALNVLPQQTTVHERIYRLPV